MDLASCPFCGETTKLRTEYNERGPFGFAVNCDTCMARGPVESGEEATAQAVANWNRRPTSTLAGVITMDQVAVGVSSGTGMALPDACPIGNFDPIDGKWNGEGDLRDTWWNRGVADGLRTAQRVAEENGSPATAAAIQKSIDHHSAVLARMLAMSAAFVGSKDTGVVSTDTSKATEGQIIVGPDRSPVPLTVLDDLAAAREKRDLAGLPSLTVTAEPDGLSMDFDLGGDKPRKR